MLLISFFIIGCTGVEPYEPRNDREEGVEKGLFTGEDGEFVIFRKNEDSESDIFKTRRE